MVILIITETLIIKTGSKIIIIMIIKTKIDKNFNTINNINIKITMDIHKITVINLTTINKIKETNKLIIIMINNIKIMKLYLNLKQIF